MATIRQKRKGIRVRDATPNYDDTFPACVNGGRCRHGINDWVFGQRGERQRDESPTINLHIDGCALGDNDGDVLVAPNC